VRAKKEPAAARQAGASHKQVGLCQGAAGVSRFLTAALEYLDRGLCVIPVRRDKRPAVRWKVYQSRRPTPAEVRGWFAGGSKLNLAVVCGQVSGGLAVLDFDEPDAWETWRAAHPELAARLPRVRTGRGIHLWARLRNPQATRFLDGGELRGEGGYVVAPPSVHACGRRYEWERRIEEDIPLIEGFFEGETKRIDNDDKVNRDYREVLRRCGTLREPLKEDMITPLIEATLPTGPGQRVRRLFSFLRRLKGLPVNEPLTREELEPLVRLWWQKALPHVRTKPWLETWVDALRAWDRIRWPHGVDVVDEAVRRAADEIPRAAMRYADDPGCIRLVAVCYHLAKMQDGRFWLTARRAAEIAGVSVRSAWLYMQGLVADGLLIVERPGTRTKPTVYRWAKK